MRGIFVYIRYLFPDDGKITAENEQFVFNLQKPSLYCIMNLLGSLKAKFIITIMLYNLPCDKLPVSFAELLHSLSQLPWLQIEQMFQRGPCGIIEVLFHHSQQTKLLHQMVDSKMKMNNLLLKIHTP